MEGTLETLNLTTESQDRIVVNILANVIIDLAHELVTRLGHGGTLIASGIIDEYVKDVEEAFETAGLDIEERRHNKDWTALIATKN